MSYILAATDFSPAAENALHYACQLAQDSHLNLTILHSFMIPVSFGDNPMPVMIANDGREAAEERLEVLANSLKLQHPLLSISTQVSYGDIVDVLDEKIQQQKPALIILGNDGEEGDIAWLGSNLISAMRHLKVPVLSVPSQCRYKKVERICYSCDFKNNDDTGLALDIKTMLTVTQSQLHVLYIDKNNNESSEEQLLSMESSAMHNSLKESSPVYHFVEKDNIETGIADFVNDNAIDWLIIIPHKHSLLDNFFKKSHTKSLVKKIEIPLLALHEYH